MFLRTLLALTCLAAFTPAQRGGDQESARAQRKRAAIEQGVEFREDGSDGTKEGGKRQPDEEWEKLTPEERLNRNIRSGANAYCTFVANPKPAKLMPGQTGVLVITAILKGSTVIPSPAPLEVISASLGGMATIGTPAFRPAEIGKGGLAKGYLGRPVYDNWAIFELPITMSADAVVGRKVPIAIEMRFDLFDGASAQTIGRFLDRVSAEIEVGQAADPSVVGGVPSAAQSGRVVQAAGDSQSDAEKDADRKTAGSTRAVGAAAPPLVAESPAALPVAPSGVPAPALTLEDSSLPMPLLLGAGSVIVLVLILILARRK
jgi:hypothetical protein